MRRFVDRRVAGRAEAHAFVIGVGIYPHLAGGPPDAHLFKYAGALGQLTSPPISAEKFAQWIEGPYHDPVAPLGTLDVLVSSAADTAADAPSMENIRKAVKEWKKRADTHRDNVAVFYFCGHGVSAGLHDGLLACDFGADDDAVLEHCIDIGGLQLAMDACRAARQVFFIDACRSTPAWLTDLVIDGGIGDAIFDPRMRQGRYGVRDAPRFFATSPNQKAYGRRGGVSLFTEALLETFSSAGAARVGKQWIVRTDTMLPGLNQMLALLSARDRLPYQPAVLDRVSGYDFHVLPGPPEVHVSVGCEPANANGLADLALRCGGADWIERASRESAAWRLKRMVGTYDIRARFDSGPFRDVEQQETVWPPACDLTLQVLP